MIPARQVWPEEFAARYRAKGYWRGETFGAMLRERARAHGDREAVVGGEERWTYAELDRRADAAAAGFLALGLEPGERVVVQLPNVVRFFSVVFGLFRAGLVPVYALPAHRLAEMSHFAEKSEAAAIVVADRWENFDYRPLAADVRGAVGTVREIVVVGEAGEGMVPFSELEGASGPLPPDPDPESVAFMQVSGGTTGLSKLIPRTHDDYIYSFRESAVICGQDETSVYLTALPVAHNYPMSSPGVFGTLHAGGRVVLAPSPAPDAAFALIARERVTITGVVPPICQLWLQAAPNTRHDLSSLRVLQVGGAKLAPEIARRVRPVLGCMLQQVFGMAEGDRKSVV